MTELPRKGIARGARLAALPLGYAGRKAMGFGKRLGGAPAEMVLNEIQQRTAEQLFKTLGELKGGAMKFGQALSVLEAALPDELVAPYRDQPDQAAGRRAPDADPDGARPAGDDLGPNWKNELVWLDGGRPRPPASARCTRGAGRTGATSR